jgi:hypothetical protein
MHINRYQALKRMRELTQAATPFSVTFLTYSMKTNQCNGFKTVQRCLLNKGFRKDQSKHAHQLIGYTDCDQDEASRFMHLPLIISFNQYTVTP